MRGKHRCRQQQIDYYSNSRPLALHTRHTQCNALHRIAAHKTATVVCASADDAAAMTDDDAARTVIRRTSRSCKTVFGQMRERPNHPTLMQDACTHLQHTPMHCFRVLSDTRMCSNTMHIPRSKLRQVHHVPPHTTLCTLFTAESGVSNWVHSMIHATSQVGPSVQHTGKLHAALAAPITQHNMCRTALP